MEKESMKPELVSAGYMSRFLSSIIDGLVQIIVLFLIVYPWYWEIFQEFFTIIKSSIYYDTTFVRDLAFSSEKLEYNQEQLNKHLGPVSLLGVFLLGALGTFYEPISTKIFGETIGRKVMNIKIVNLDGTNISYFKRCFRVFYKQCISGYFGILYLLFLPTYYNPRKRLPHDFGISTRVISTDTKIKSSNITKQESNE